MLFDRGYLTVSPDHHVQVSRRRKEEFDNGKEYYALAGKTILLPDNPAFRPSAEQCFWQLASGSSAHLVILPRAADSGNNGVSSGGLSGTPRWDNTHWFQMPEKLFCMKCEL